VLSHQWFKSRERHSRVSQCETEAFCKNMSASKTCRLRLSSMWSPVSGLLVLLLFTLESRTISVFQFPFEICNHMVSVFQFLLKITEYLIFLLILIQQKGDFLLLCTLPPWGPSRGKRLLIREPQFLLETDLQPSSSRLKSQKREIMTKVGL